MHKALFLLCPTDCLESVINHAFKCESYFYCSLGNSFMLDINTLDGIKELIIKHNIRSINFVLSSDNQIILDALGGQFFSEVKGLRTFYAEISRQKKQTKTMWLADNYQYLTLSYFLNNKIKELQYELGNLPVNSIKIKGKIYNRLNRTFKNIYPDIICIEKHYLN